MGVKGRSCREEKGKREKGKGKTRKARVQNTEEK